MKTIYYKIMLILFLFPVSVLAGTGKINNDFNGKFTKQKKISKEYNVTTNALLEVHNRYGNIEITTWNENRIVIEVTVKTNGNNEEEVLERLKEIDVNFQNSTSHVRAETVFEERNSSWWSNLFGGGSNVNMEINYRIKAPVTNNIEIGNDYGSISVDKLKGNATIACDYGRLIIGELLGNNNLLAFDYTRNSQIDFIKKGKIVADYSEFTVGEAETLEVIADYTDSHIKKVKNIRFKCDYGSFILEKVQNVKGEGDYLATKLGSVYNSAELYLDYGSASIENLMESVKNVKIESDYASIKIGYGGSPFSFQLETSYGDVKGLDAEGFQVNKSREDGSDNFYEGFYLSDNSGTMININTEYGNITFND